MRKSYLRIWFDVTNHTYLFLKNLILFLYRPEASHDWMELLLFLLTAFLSWLSVLNESKRTGEIRIWWFIKSHRKSTSSIDQNSTYLLSRRVATSSDASDVKLTFWEEQASSLAVVSETRHYGTFSLPGFGRVTLLFTTELVAEASCFNDVDCFFYLFYTCCFVLVRSVANLLPRAIDFCVGGIAIVTWLVIGISLY